MMTFDFTGQSVVITAAGSGIGKASALLFAEHGASVTVSDLHEDAAQATTKLITEQGGVAQAVACDVRQPEAVNSLVQTALDQYGRLDVMYNNAGGGTPGPFHETSLRKYEMLRAWNLDSVVYGSLAALDVMLKQGSGVILATSSGAGLGAMPGLAVYGAAKAGINHLMSCIAAEYAKQGIRANAISAGAMDTPALRGWTETLPGGHEAHSKRQPSGRFGTPEEIAQAALFLASDHAKFINGVVLPVDGVVSSLLASPQ